jgi:hypothetical protein
MNGVDEAGNGAGKAAVNPSSATEDTSVKNAKAVATERHSAVLSGTVSLSIIHHQT